MDPRQPTSSDLAIPQEASIRHGRFDRILDLDQTLLLGIRRWHAPWRTRVARALTRAGGAWSWTVAGLGLLATRTAIGVQLGLRLGAATLLATALSQALKRSLIRARPTGSIEGFAALARDPDAFSFPSGHTCAAFAVAVVFTGAPFALGPAALLLATGVGLSRVYLGAHYPLDVIAGALLGTVAGLLAHILVG